MRILQDIFDSQIEEQISFHKIGVRLIKKRLGELGIILTDDQLAEIESKLLNSQGDAVTISIDNDQLPTLDPSSEEKIRNTLRLDLSDYGEDLEGLLERLINDLSEAIPEIVEEASNPILKQLKRNAPSMLRGRKKDRKSFEIRLAKVWRKPLNLLEILLAIAFEAGDDFNREFRPEASEQNDCVFEVLTRLHARACQIASEILALLRSGYGDGAHARWRSLHEIAAVGFFIQSAGNEVAERYLLHNAIESYRAAQQYQEHCKALGYEPLTEKELDEIESEYQHLLSRFGSAYKENYGWAASAIRKNPTFRDIEQEVGLNHLRPFYRMASHNVHANPKGIFFKLGLYSSQEILLAGPSNTGLADPGHGAAISLGQITIALLGTRPNIDRLVICSILTKLMEEIGDAFLEAQRSLKNNGAT